MASGASNDVTQDVIWLKRDFRLADHLPLHHAGLSNHRVLVLYVYEPEVIEAEEFHPAHLLFINKSLQDLHGRLMQQYGVGVHTRVGKATDVLGEVLAKVGRFRLLSHHETPVATQRARNTAVREWCGRNNIRWHEFQQTGVIPDLSSRDDRKKLFDKHMNAPPVPPPARLSAVEIDDPQWQPTGVFPSLSDLGLPECTFTEKKVGGETLALAELESFLFRRGVNYAKDLSSPVTGWDGCSRLSPYLTWGCISLRTVLSRTKKRIDAVKARRAADSKKDGKKVAPPFAAAAPASSAASEGGGGGSSCSGPDVDPFDSRWGSSLSAFRQRLHWRSHFIQKMEDEPEIEHSNMCRAYDGVREGEFDEASFAAWCEGRTGYPMVDACMRCLHQGGWINFRMRAMLVSFAAYDLFLHWRRPAVFLARLFLDFEPGIHYSQFQMQSGTTGINTFRVYSPVKQAQDHDKDGTFVRKYVPELANVPQRHIYEPWKMPKVVQEQCGCVIDSDYPSPIVDHKEATKAAMSKLGKVKRSVAAKDEAQQIVKKHGSRRKPNGRINNFFDRFKKQPEAPIPSDQPCAADERMEAEAEGEMAEEEQRGEAPEDEGDPPAPSPKRHKKADDDQRHNEGSLPSAAAAAAAADQAPDNHGDPGGGEASAVEGGGRHQRRANRGRGVGVGVGVGGQQRVLIVQTRRQAEAFNEDFFRPLRTDDGTPLCIDVDDD
ncbi:unnamed protein product [Vitrella brassicaformis CCMP3155]|uniref:Photolyase/cryptochrome alpha/beta domain-containing protein n=2 Tax=Vitrella brassicaformis TaxID=1169539 RepID=A0A0G4EUL5_VITBC|nr:unnamed protein product [Vitrella brassicaformis CCMP3155]|eukprot:CEM02128.1 unnamed protein product [Vitrella brassicaformis CCMP3155]